MSQSTVDMLTPSGSRTITEQTQPDGSTETFPTLHLRLNKPATKKKVQWTGNTVDNEHMNKKKSKCCCIYKKPRNFGESSSESEDECENCYGHVEMKKSNQPHQHHSHSNEDASKDPDPHDKVPGECSH